ncbi:alpha/beta hydrolase [Neobacillus mesonae]|uniref:RBBP9/YdeN family alpha/beta hydrolase n=1 Tax=Neobacillus mesonae TaxID=1193713 RepID=UPI0020412021|nr:alpha/beta fold hydrolase [Neobacillus mesonae]MCM3568289.1 alpha/beta hydrolase [Neobacillus mesonae]
MNQQSFLILHGLGGSGQDHWQTWLAKELAGRNYHVSYPVFSTFDSPNKEVWLQELDAAMDLLPKHLPLTVVTHSLGSIIWLHYAARLNKKIANKAILVAPPSPKVILSEAKSFFPVPLDRRALSLAAEETLFIHSSNDPYCSLKDADLYKNMGLSSITFPNMGHINPASGYGRWEWILDQCLMEKRSAVGV